MSGRKNNTRNREHLSDREVALFVDALALETIDQVPVDWREHVAGCHRCKKEITGLFALLHADDAGVAPVRQHPTFTLKPRTRAFDGFPLLRVAAAIAVITGLSVLAYFAGSWMGGRVTPGLQAEKAVIGIDSLRKRDDGKTKNAEKGGVDLASSMTVNADLEDLVNSQSRSEVFEVLSPLNGAVISSRQAFTWRPVGTEPLTLSVIDNKGRVVLTTRVSGTPYILTRALPSGLFYWKVQSESELLYVGKFLVILPLKQTPPT